MKNENLIEMTPAEAAKYMWQHITRQVACDFVVPWSIQGEEITGTIYRCALLNIAGRSTVVANAYGGGELFACEISVTSPMGGTVFAQQFEKYLHSLGGEILVCTVPQHMCGTNAISQADFVLYVEERLHTATTIKFRTESGIPYTFCVTDIYADAPVAMCNCNAGGSFFAHDISNEEGLESFKEAFTAYLNKNGIGAVLVDF